MDGPAATVAEKQQMDQVVDGFWFMVCCFWLLPRFAQTDYISQPDQGPGIFAVKVALISSGT